MTESNYRKLQDKLDLTDGKTHTQAEKDALKETSDRLTTEFYSLMLKE
jgi:hypothetical protein